MIMKVDFNSSHLNVLLRQSLIKIFGKGQDKMLTDIEKKISWLQMKAGQELFHQNDEGLGIYFVLIGKLKMVIESPEKKIIFATDILRGEMVGEISLLTGEKRSGTIIAVRDSVLALLSKQEYDEIMKLYPIQAGSLAKSAIQRLIHDRNPRKLPSKPSTICLLPVSEGLALGPLADSLVEIFSKWQATTKIDINVLNSVWTKNSTAELQLKEILENTPLLQSWLDEQEAQQHFIVYIADKLGSPWAEKCFQMSDAIFLIADVNKDHQISLEEKELYTSNKYLATKYLVLIHGSNTNFPRNTEQWLKNREIKTHIHIRAHHEEDLKRLARIMSGRANGLVLSGGGAKGFAHLGVYKALLEYGIPVDFVGGTSIGALIGAFISLGLGPDQIKQMVRSGAHQNPTSDYSFFPLLSIIKGQRLHKLIKNAIQQSVGFEINIEDMWYNFFAVSCNFTSAQAITHSSGRLFDTLLASISIPGAFPPVLNGQDLLMDGGAFNNFPTDIMNNEMQITNIIGVELARDRIKRINLKKLPSGWEMFVDKLKPKSKRKYDLPSLVSIMLNATLFYSEFRREELKGYVDLYFSPEVSNYNMMEWSAFDKIFETGYHHAISVLQNMTTEEISHFKS